MRVIPKVKAVIVLFGLMALLLFSTFTFVAVPHSFATTTCAIVTPTTTHPSNGRIIDVTQQVTHDEDSGFIGYWALDHYTRTIQVWETSPNNFFALVTYKGQSVTYVGARSPETGATQTENGVATMKGGYTATFTGTFLGSSSTEPTSGSIGTFNYGGTKSDVLLGSYGNGQKGDSSAVDWTTFYFSGVSGFNQPMWGWAYHVPNTPSTDATTNWCNSSAGSSGDIIIP